MDKLKIKTEAEIQIMAHCGHLLAGVRNKLAKAVVPGISCIEIEELACKLIDETGGKASFKMVPGYKHATCLSVNDVVVHGIPNEYVIKNGDVVGIDVGLYLDGFHTDTSTTVAAGEATSDIQLFLETGRRAMDKSIKAVKIGRKISDISMAMQEIVEKSGFSTIKALTGHGVGRELHEEPAIPCFVPDGGYQSPIIREGMVLAIEVMYNQGTSEVVYKNNDGWTIVTADGKISGLFEHTVAVLKSGPVILTE
jgi:methionyl aminopeptidase